MDFVLINPGNRLSVYQNLSEICAIEPPTFMALVATYLINIGFDGIIIDIPSSSESIEEIATKVCSLNPAIIGVFVYGYQPSASTQNMSAAREICNTIKMVNSDMPIMISGTHPSALPEQTLIEEQVDYVCDREGFSTIEGLINLSKRKIKLNEIPSLWYYDDDGIITHNKTAELFNESQLNKLVNRPAWQLLQMDKYRSHNWHAFETQSRTPYASIYTSLGCPYRCSFCCINSPFGKPSYRMWSPDVIINQIDELVNKYGVSNIKFVDEMFVLNESHVIGICDRIIDRGYDLNIWAYARVDSVKDKFLSKLYKAGFKWLALGIESDSDEVLENINKNYSHNDVFSAVKSIQSHGINVLGNYMFGLPKDNMKSMKQTLDLAIDLNCEFVNFYCAMAYPGSKLYKTAVEQDLDLPESWLGYSQHSYETFPLNTQYISNAQVLKFRDEAFIQYYSGDAYINMIKNKFGDFAITSIQKMMNICLNRKLKSE